MPSAPDWQKNPARPGPGTTSASVALSLTSAEVLITPSALGPTTRIPCALASLTSRRSETTPALPTSENPAEMTTSVDTPLDRQSSRTSDIEAAGTATTARSTGSGMCRTLAYARTDCTEVASELTG